MASVGSAQPASSAATLSPAHHEVMALLPAARQEMYRYYRLSLGCDATAGKVIGERTVFHPILAPYLICDLLKAHAEGAGEQALAWAGRIADRALALAQRFENDSLVFWYDPADALSSIPTRFYSGLTQAWYIKAIGELARSRPAYGRYIGGLFRSLLVPIEQDGPLLRRDFGWVVEEYPYAPPLYTLNGWLTVLRWLLESKHLIADQPGAEEFFARNLDAVANLLPLYDAGFLANSRYQLTGFARVKLVADVPGALRLDRFNVEIPGEGTFPGQHGRTSSDRWGNYIEKVEHRTHLLNLVLSMVCFPKANQLGLQVTTPRALEISPFLASGAYDPLATALPTRAWTALAKQRIPAGTHALTIDIPLGSENLVAYPTNFKKKVKGSGGLNYNGYHFVHIMDLAVMYHLTGRIVFRDFAERWLGYLARWPTLDFLPADRFSHSHYTGVDFERSARRLLDAAPSGHGAAIPQHAAMHPSATCLDSIERNPT